MFMPMFRYAKANKANKHADLGVTRIVPARASLLELCYTTWLMVVLCLRVRSVDSSPTVERLDHIQRDFADWIRHLGLGPFWPCSVDVVLPC